MCCWSDPDVGVGLGHTRLAIIDLATGRQPMVSLDGRFVTVFNGEIYNYMELRGELEGYGYAFRTKSDTEVLLNAFDKWGDDSLIRLNGMFAFAIFDKKARKLFLARDRTGIKPLYYYEGPDSVIFASEIKGILSWPTVPRRLNRHAIADFIRFGYPLGHATCFLDCRELEPGHFVEFSGCKKRKVGYWKWQRRPSESNTTDALVRVEAELRSAVREHLIADVPVGAFLSGGIDSSLLVALHAQATPGKLHTFTVRFGEAGYDESAYASLVAKHVGTVHHEITLDSSEGGLEIASRVLDQFDQPFGDSSAIPTYLICGEIRKHVKVVLGGDGGDEMFGGYERFAYADVARQLSHLPVSVLRSLEKVATVAGVFSNEWRRQLVRLLRVAQKSPRHRLRALNTIVQSDDLTGMLGKDFLSSVAGCFSRFEVGSDCPDPGGEELMDFTVRWALPGDYLRKIDVMSSAHGLEVRVPMLANRMLDLSESLPTKLKYSIRENKILLRRLARKLLPARIAARKKHGFGIPMDVWLGANGRNEVSALISSPAARIRDFFRADYLATVAKQFAARRWDSSTLSRYSLYQRIYYLWAFERWLNRWQPAS